MADGAGGVATMKVLVFGAGFSGRRFARMRPETARVLGTTRSADKFGSLREVGLEPFLFASRTIAPDLQRELTGVTHLVVSIAPDDQGDPVLDALKAPMPALQWVGYLSTVGVYGDYSGAWVDEESPCKPVSNRSRERVEAERQWLDYGARFGVPVSVLRLSGIYGPGRNAFVNLQNGTAKRLIKPGQVFNRIHADDIAGVLWHLIDRNLGGVYNVTDDEPSPPQDVVAYAAKLMGIEPPPEVPFETAQLSPMARSFYAECKRVSNAKIKKTGFGFAYPDYRRALETMWKEQSWGA
ncbi:MAG: SDR family oxidoreductase [Rhizobiaceae bacterium]|nr:SDR family oxidoreductase [Rhizobiaceae bacterium]